MGIRGETMAFPGRLEAPEGCLRTSELQASLESTVTARDQSADKKDCLIGVIEDDPVTAALLETILERAGYTGVTFRSPAEFRKTSGAGSVDLLLLDWDMPGESGLEFLCILREQDRITTPVIFVTHYGDDERVAEGLNAGADDYVIKPVVANVLIARIESVLRRLDQRPRVEDKWPPFEFDISNRLLRIDGEPCSITDREYDLMLFMFRRAGRIVSRNTLLKHVWHLNSNVKTRSIDTHFSRLRKVFGLDGSSGWRLEGVYQKGYCLKQVPGPQAVDQ